MGLSKVKLFLICFGVFLIGFVSFFPFQTLKGPLLKTVTEQSGILILAEDLQPLFLGWPGMRLRKVSASVPMGLDSFDIESDSLDLRFRLASLFVPSISLFFDRLSAGGSLFLQGGTRGDSLYLKARSQDLNLSGLAIPGLSGRLGGLIDSDISLQYNDSIFSQSTGTINLKGKKFIFPATLINNPMLGLPFQVPELGMDPIQIDISVANGVAKLKSFLLGSGASDLKAELSGDVQLGVNPLDTQINLTLKLNFAERISQNQEYKTFLDFLRAYQLTKKGEYGMAWKGRLGDIMNLPLPSPLK